MIHMAVRTITATAKICAMCQHWNGPMGGQQVKPLINRRPFFEFESEETQTCYKQHLAKQAWHSCSGWVRRY